MSSSIEAVDGPRVVMLGPPGSGKGTHARLLAERFNFPTCRPARCCAARSLRRSTLGLRVAAAVDAGQLVDGAAIIDLVRTAITSPDCPAWLDPRWRAPIGPAGTATEGRCLTLLAGRESL